MDREEMIEKIQDYCDGLSVEECVGGECIIEKKMGCLKPLIASGEELTRACELIEKAFTPNTKKLILNNFLKGSRR